MKKLILVLFCIVIVTAVFASGGQAAAGAGRTPASFLTPPGQVPLVTQPYTINLGTDRQVSVTDYYDNFFTKWLQGRTGITLNFEFFAPGNDGNTQFELMVSSGEKLPDIVALNVPNWRDHGESGVFIDLNPYFETHAFFYNQAMEKLREKYGDYRERDRIRIRTSTATGKRVSYPAYNDNESDLQLHTTMINKPWLDRLGLRAPTTTQELRDVLIAFRDRDPNGNGQRDEIPMIGSLQSWHSDPVNWLINAFVYWSPEATNAGTLNVTNGRLWVPYTTDEYRDALRYIRGLITDGLLAESVFTITEPEMINLLNPANDVYTVGISTGHPVLVWRAGGTTPDHYVCLPSLTGPRGVNWAPVGPPAVINGARAYITKDAQYPDVAFRLLDFFSDEYTGMLMRWGEEGADWTWAKPGETSVYGHKALYDTPNLLWGATAQNTNWRQTIGYFQIDPYGVFRDDGSFTSKRAIALKDYINMNRGKQPTEYVDEVVMTQDEQDSIREIQNSITTYVNEQRAYFCTGQRDIERDWNAYLSELDRMGLQRYLEIVQKAYTRTISF